MRGVAVTGGSDGSLRARRLPCDDDADGDGADEHCVTLDPPHSGSVASLAVVCGERFAEEGAAGDDGEDDGAWADDGAEGEGGDASERGELAARRRPRPKLVVSGAHDGTLRVWDLSGVRRRRPAAAGGEDDNGNGGARCLYALGGCEDPILLFCFVFLCGCGDSRAGRAMKSKQKRRHVRHRRTDVATATWRVVRERARYRRVCAGTRFGSARSRRTASGSSLMARTTSCVGSGGA